jgi:hypothetical protein
MDAGPLQVSFPIEMVAHYNLEYSQISILYTLKFLFILSFQQTTEGTFASIESLGK